MEQDTNLMFGSEFSNVDNLPCWREQTGNCQTQAGQDEYNRQGQQTFLSDWTHPILEYNPIELDVLEFHGGRTRNVRVSTNYERQPRDGLRWIGTILSNR